MNVENKRIQIMAMCANELDKECQPKYIEIIERFPIKPSGKRDMDELRKIALKKLNR